MPVRNSAMYASKSHLSRNFSAAQRPESKSASARSLLRSNSVVPTPSVGIGIVRA